MLHRLQRPYFEKELRRELTSEDIQDIPSYYQPSTPLTSSISSNLNSSISPPVGSSSPMLSPHNQFTVLEWKARPIGYLALDATSPDEVFSNLEDKGVLPTEEATLKSKAASLSSTSNDTNVLDSKSTEKSANKPTPRLVALSALPSHALIRHFHVDRVYQQAGVQDDLINEVLSSVFTAPAASSMQKIEKVYVRVTSTQPSIEEAFRRCGFVSSVTRRSGKVGGRGNVFGIREKWLNVEREAWLKAQKGTSE